MKMLLYFAQSQKPIYTSLCFHMETWNIESRGKSKPFFFFFFFASTLESGPGSWVTVSVISGQPCKAIGLHVHYSRYLIVLMVGLQMQRQCEEGSCREQESVPPNIATCCSSLGTAAKLEINYINNEWSRIDLKSRLCPSCQWDDKVYVESWDSLNDKCPLMQLCKHHRKCVRR